MAISVEFEPELGVQVWHYSGRLALSDFDSLETQLLELRDTARQCSRLVISYKRGLDVSEMDAQTQEQLLVRVKAIHASVLDKCIKNTAHVCPDDIVRHAVEHYVLRVDKRADDMHGVFVTRREADIWFAQSNTEKGG